MKLFSTLISLGIFGIFSSYSLKAASLDSHDLKRPADLFETIVNSLSTKEFLEHVPVLPSLDLKKKQLEKLVEGEPLVSGERTWSLEKGADLEEIKEILQAPTVTLSPLSTEDHLLHPFFEIDSTGSYARNFSLYALGSCPKTLMKGVVLRVVTPLSVEEQKNPIVQAYQWDSSFAIHNQKKQESQDIKEWPRHHFINLAVTYHLMNNPEYQKILILEILEELTDWEGFSDLE